MSGLVGQVGARSGVVGSTTDSTQLEYEEGTWTPSLGGDTSYNAQYGRYQKVGNICHIQFKLAVNIRGTGSMSNMGGLPFTSANISSVQTGCCSYYVNLAINTEYVAFYVENNATDVLFVSSTGSPASGVTNGPSLFNDNSVIYGSASYFIA